MASCRASIILHRPCGIGANSPAESFGGGADGPAEFLCATCQTRAFAIMFSDVFTSQLPVAPFYDGENVLLDNNGNNTGVRGICFPTPQPNTPAYNIVISSGFNILQGVNSVAGAQDLRHSAGAVIFDEHGIQGIFLKWEDAANEFRALTVGATSPMDGREDAIQAFHDRRNEMLVEELQFDEDLKEFLPPSLRLYNDEAAASAAALLGEYDAFASTESPLQGSVILRFKVAEEKLADMDDVLGRAADALSLIDVRHVAWFKDGVWKSRSIGRRSSSKRVTEKLEQARDASKISNLFVYLDIDNNISDPRVKDFEGQVRLLLCPMSAELAQLAPTGNLGSQTRLILTLIKEKRMEEAKFWILGARTVKERLDAQYRNLIQRITPVRDFGPRRLGHLKREFQTPKKLLAATKEQLAIPGKIPATTAARIFAALHEEKPAVDWCGKKHALLWNKKTKMKVAPHCAPLMNEADDWLRKNPKYEWYAGQEKEEETPSTVPTGMSRSLYKEYCEAPAEELDKPGLDQTLKNCELMRVVQQSDGSGVDLFSALSKASGLRGFSCVFDDIRGAVVKEVGEDAELYDQLMAAANFLRMPIWVYTSTAIASDDGDGERVVLIKPSEREEKVPDRAPLRLSQHDGAFHALVAMAGTASGDNLLPAPIVPQPEKQIHESKDELEEKLKLLWNLIQRIEEETKEAGAELCLDAFKTKLDELIRALRFRDGQSAVMLGHNGVGKTTIINLLHHITLMGAEEYRAVLEGYVPEALQLLFDSDSDSPTLDISLSSLMSTNAETRKWLQTNGVDVDPAPPLSDPDGAAASRRAEGLAHEAEQSIRAYCEGDPKPPKIDHGVLPSGEPGGTTTSLITYEHYGRIVHLLVVLKTLAEVKEKMQEFVTLWKVADGTTVGMSGEEREALFRAWSYYYALAHGHEYDGLLTGRFERDLPKCEDLPKSKDAIQVCQSVLQLLKTRYLLFLGRGESIHLDCAMVRQQLLELNAGKSEMQVLRRMVVEKVEVFLPAAVLEGGNGFVDLPGTSDPDAVCQQQTYDGVQNAAAVFVVVPRGLNADQNSINLLTQAGVVKRVLQSSDDKGSCSVAILINREKGDGGYNRMEALGENEEQLAQPGVENSRKMWRRIVVETNKDLRDEGLGRTDEEVEEIVKNTEIRNIYPMTHASFTTNQEYAQNHPDEAKRVLELSNIYWLTGVLTARNREKLVRQLQQLVDEALPQLLATVHASQRHESVSDKTMKTAELFLVGRYERFGIYLDALVLETTKLMGDYRSKLEKQVEAFFEGDAVRTFLKKAKERQPGLLNPLLVRLKRRFAAVRAVCPANKGNLKNYRLKPVAFGGDDNTIDFDPLVETILATMKEAMERVVELQVNTIAIMLPKDSGSDDDDAISTLKESYFSSDLDQLSERFTTRFFAARQHSADLRQPALVKSYLRRLASDACDKAVHRCILSQSDGLSSANDVKDLIVNNLDDVRATWKSLAFDGIFKLVDKQLKTLKTDLTKGGTGRPFMLRQGLVAFLKLVIQHYQVRVQPQLQKLLKDFHAQLRREHEQLSDLCHSFQETQDPKAIGIEATRPAEKRRHTAWLLRRELKMSGLESSTHLGPPNRAMPMTDLAIVGKFERFRSIKRTGHVFARGSESGLEDLAITFKSLGRQLAKVGSMPDVFSALCVTAWTNLSIKRGERHLADALPAASKQLRAIAVADLQQRFNKFSERVQAQLFQALGKSFDEYLEQLRSPEYTGDLLCLWALAMHFKKNILVFRPGGGLPVLITFSNSAISEVEKLPTYHLAITASGGSKGTANWFCSAKKSVRVRMSNQNQIRELLDTDGMTDDDVEARKGPSRKRKAPDSPSLE